MSVTWDALSGVKHVDFGALKGQSAIIALGRRDRREAKCTQVPPSLPPGSITVRVVGSAISILAAGPIHPAIISDLEDIFYLFVNGDDEGFRRALLSLLKRSEIQSVELNLTAREL
jgi:hypothetical protein